VVVVVVSVGADVSLDVEVVEGVLFASAAAFAEQYWLLPFVV